MPCEHMGVLLSRYVDGEASAEDRCVVERHVRECADCKQELEVFRRNEELLSQALSQEVAGEAFIAEVLAKAGLAPSRQGPIRSRLSRAASAVATFFSVPARAIAVVLVGISVFLAWDSHSVHRENERWIAEIQAALSRIRESNDVNHQLVRLVQDMKDAVQRTAAQAEKAPPVEAVPDPTSPPPQQVVVDHPGPAEPLEQRQEVKALLPTDFFHSVAAISYKEGVYLSWETKPPMGKVTYDIYRQDAAGQEFMGPINASPILVCCYLDESARPASTYAYQVVAIPAVGEPEKSRVIEIHTLGDIRIQNNGSMTLGTESRSFIDVQRYVDGRWLNAIFLVAEGQPIGARQYCKETRSEVDFSTGYVLRRITDEEREVKRLVWDAARDGEGNFLRDPRTGSFYYVWREVTEKVTTNRISVTDRSGKEYKLWKGEGRRGTLGSLE